EEFVEPVNSRQELVAIAQMVLAKLPGSITKRLEQFGDGRILRLDSQRRPWQTDLSHAGPDRRLTGNERRAPGGAALLPVPVSESRAFLRDAVDVRCLVTHDAAVVATRVKPAYVIAPDNEDVRFLRLGEGACD